MKFILTTCLSILLTSCFAPRIFAQAGKIEGTITNSDGQPLISANVYIKEIGAGTVTDNEGKFVLLSIQPGVYQLVASSVGFITIQNQITVADNKTTTIHWKLMESTHELDEVTILNSRSLNEQTSNISKSNIRAFDLPQSVMTLSKEVLVQQQTLRLSDALRNVNGLYVMGTTGGTQEELAGRGFAYNSNNTFKNGARFNNGVLPEMSSLERVEVMKGSNAILFGNVAAGGVINLVTKKPIFEKGGEVSMRIGSYGFYKPSIDLYGPLDTKNKFAYRINTTYESANSFRDEVQSKRFYINPSFLVRLNSKTDILVEADYLEDNRTLDYGTGAINYAVANIPRNRFLGSKWSYFAATQKSLTVTVNHQLNADWKLRVMVAGQDYGTDLFGTTRPNANNQFIKSDGKWVRGLQRTEVAENYLVAQADLTGQFKTGRIQHTLLVGVDADGYNTQTTAYTNLAKYDSINVFNLEAFKQRNDIPELSKRTLTKNPTQRIGVYVQDLVSLTSQLKFLLGARYSYLDRQNEVFTFPTATAQASNAITNNYDGAITPRFGLVYQPFSSTSLFASYANSFNLNSGIDINSNPLPPSFIDQYEIGVKNELLKGLLSANVTAYQIVNSNFTQAVIIPTGNPNNIPANAQELAGEVTSKGIEVDIMTKAYRGFSVIAGYSYNETRYTRSNIFIEGSLLRYNPQHTANMSIYYQLPAQSRWRNFNAGVTFFYTGDRVAGRSTRLTIPNDAFKLMPIPNFTQVDATLGYVHQKVSVRLRISNLFDTLSYYVHDDNSVNPLAPRMMSATFGFKL
ncbi:MAG: TonB-dependent receptor [Bacteroidetes bacterium]|nr:TonB-dependent receptor [Bacteroidota bacterium]